MAYLNAHTSVLTTIEDTGVFDDATEQAASAAVEEFKAAFRTEDGKLLQPPVDAAKVNKDDIEQAQIVTGRRK